MNENEPINELKVISEVRKVNRKESRSVTFTLGNMIFENDE